ncbi:hypothetical protein QSJ18_18140 [Gordonia sp. ABSL1-1]|uniref:hypothetical protein n=1 Tax=Gordonia sp. ABSL1-1 TaxID=3053923 RepID=UPI002572DC17|nr:hypothetical protein [Gordonia sp. ABSL1-1]MDL9938670.1 hypothetical protein [Gordonia sp. ABSL1-1]
MTTPNLPWGTTGPEDLPQGVVHPSQLGTSLQGHSAGQLRALMAARFPAFLGGEMTGAAGDTSGPLGLLVDVVSKFQAAVAAADPATITKPADLLDLAHDVISDLPLVGRFVDLWDAMLGEYTGDDPILEFIQNLFAPLRKVLELASGVTVGLPTVDDVVDGWAQIAANFEELQHAVAGTYTGTDAFLLAIQNTIGILRTFATGIINPARLPQLALGALSNQASSNLLSEGAFREGITLDEGDGWSWDNSDGVTVAGCALCVASGVTSVRTSEAVPVSEGQTLNITAQVRKTGLTGSGTLAELQVWALNGATTVATVAVGTVTSGTAGWAQIGGDYTVPAGVDTVRVRLRVYAAATGGEIRWDDVSLRKTATSLPQAWIANLVGDLGGLGDDIADALAWIKDLIEKLTGQARSTIEDAIEDMLDFGDQLKTLLSGGTVSSPLPNLLGAISIGQGQVSGLAGKLADLDDNDTGLDDAIASVVTNINSAITSDISAVTAAGTGAISDLLGTIFGVYSLANQAAQAAINANAVISANQPTDGNSLTGMSWQTTFAGADGATLSSGDWQSSSLRIRGSNGYVGIVSGAGDGVYITPTHSSHQFNTDVQSAYVVFGSADASFGKSWASGCQVHCNSAGTSGVYVLVTATTVSLGKYGSTAWTTLSRTNAPGDIVRLKSDGAENYSVSVNGKVVISYTNTGTAISKGASYRYAALVEQRGTANFGFWYGNKQADSFTIAAFGMADWTSAASGVSTPSWRLRKGTSGYSTLAVSAGASAALPSSFLTSQDLAVGCTVTTLGTGTITITNAGWYEVQLTCSSIIGSAEAYRYTGTVSTGWVVPGAGSVVSSGTESTSDKHATSQWGLSVNSTAAVGPLQSGATTTIYLASGDVIQPLIFATQTNLSAVSVGGGDGAYPSATYGQADVGSIGGPSAAFTGRMVAAA